MFTDFEEMAVESIPAFVEKIATAEQMEKINKWVQEGK